MFPGMISVFEWKGAREEASEVAMIIKTRASLTEAVLAETKRLHPYELPALLVLPTEGGSHDYCSWIASQTQERKNERTALRAGHRSRDDQHASHPVRPRRARSRLGANPAHADLSRARTGRARRGRDLAACAASRPRGAERCGCELDRSDRHHQSARDDSRVGAGNRQASRQRHCLAGPPHRRSLRRARAGSWDAHVAETTGLVIDPYFSATKLAWLLRTVPGLEARARAGDVCFGTIDSFLLFKLTGSRLHATDATNAARTKLYDIRIGRWDDRLIERLAVPRAMLPEVRDSQGDFGLTQREHFGAEIPIRGVAGDQQAAAYGQACFRPGMLKATYGTGCFVLANTGEKKVASATRMLASTIFHQLEGKRAYALEGAIFMAGATVQWLRDNLGIIAAAAESETLAEEANPNSGVYLVPAFQGLGAPFWDASARAAILGMTRATSRADVVAAGLEAVAFQTRDLLTAMDATWR